MFLLSFVIYNHSMVLHFCDLIVFRYVYKYLYLSLSFMGESLFGYQLLIPENSMQDITP